MVAQAGLDHPFKLAFLQRLALGLLHQHGRGIDETRCTVAALERKAVDELLLNRVQFTEFARVVILGMALDGAHFLAVKIVGAGDAGAYFLAGAIGVVDDHHTGMADALTAAKARTGEVLVFMQVVDHRQVLGNLDRADGLTVQGQLKQTVSH
ncbi:hypothetical protein D3C81_401400 [compost metagenome]